MRFSGVLFFTTALAVTGMPAVAQDSPTGEEEATVMDVVTVTARKRDESLNDVPTAASVIGADSLSDRGDVTTALELLSGQPGVRFLDTSTPLTGEIALRGSPTSRGTTGDPSIGLFRDGAYIAGGAVGGRNFSRMDLFDVGRVEVLRGTQGALYGRNAVGGAVNVISAKPQYETSGYASARYAFENENFRAQAVSNFAVSDSVAFRLGVDYTTQGSGFFYNDFLDTYFDQNESLGVRGQMRWRNDTTDVNARIETFEGDMPAIAFRIFIEPRPGFPNGYFQPERTYPWSTRGYSKQDLNTAALDIDHDFGWATLQSITSYRERYSEYEFDRDGANPALLAELRANGTIIPNLASGNSQYRQDDTTLFTQEFILSGVSEDERLNWLTGIEWLSLRSDSFTDTGRTPTGGNPSPGQRQPIDIEYDSLAVYGSLDYALTNQLSLAGEIRYTQDEKSALASRFDLATGLPSGGDGFNVDFSLEPDDVSYNATLAYEFANDILFYGKVGTSYRAGGFNSNLGVPEQPVPIPALYENEDSTSYEAGLKGPLGTQASFLVAAYLTQSENLIVQLNNGCFVGNPVCDTSSTSFSGNAGEAEVMGIEAEAFGRTDFLAGTLRWSLTGSYQEGEVTAGPFEGAELPQVPQWVYGFDLTYRQPVADGILLVANTNYNGQRGGVHDLTTPGSNEVNFDMDRVDLLNARFGLDFGSIEASLFGTNITDEDYLIFQGASAQRLNQPANYGVMLRYSW